MIKREEVYKIGIFNKPHGIHGELSFTFTDDIFDRVEAEYLICLLDGILVPFFLEEYRFRSDTTALVKLEGVDTAERAQLSDADFVAIRDADLSTLIAPYLMIGLVTLGVLLLIRFTKMPRNNDQTHNIDFVPTLKRIFAVPRYREGVLAQFFYVGAQIMCWTFIIQYGTRLFMETGMEEQAAEVLSQKYNIIAMAIFCTSRFICTFLLRYLNPGLLLRTLAVVAGVLAIGVIFLQDVWGMYCLVGISACMSLMFPTIYGIALQGLGDDAKFGAAGLIMAILGGSVLPPVQAAIIDLHTLWGMPAVNLSFVLPFVCFVVVTIYGHRAYRKGWA